MIKKIVLIVLAAFSFVLLAGCNKEKASAVESASDRKIEEVQEQWSEKELAEYLSSSGKWCIDETSLYDSYSSDGKFASWHDGKGEAAMGTWKAVSPATVEIEFNTGKIEKISITEIASDSFVWNGHRAKAEDSKISNGLKKKIPLFKNLDLSSLKENGGASEKYYIYPETIEKRVCTDDGSSLNYREEPMNGTKLGKFEDGMHLYITKRTFEKYTVDGLTDHWYYAVSYADIEPFGGWVFGGYLKDYDSLSEGNGDGKVDLKLLIGLWEDDSLLLDIDDENFFLRMKESEGFGGRWSLRNGNKLFVDNIQIYDEDPWSVEYEITECGEDSLVLVRTEDNWKIELWRREGK
ncbi:hypothetical protein [Treponema sp.]|uniref:hypothetical protein n=1 Tax=Treponema sp. TaxID=166 RepID=UPI00298E5FB4|nr:hypothetical protein [Treponema sp.]MCQ2241882.1 hypothetical protein [Treponema sp.]